MAITILEKHNQCPVKAVLGPYGIHYARLVCKKHKTHIQWLSPQDYAAIQHQLKTGQHRLHRITGHKLQLNDGLLRQTASYKGDKTETGTSVYTKL